MSVGRDLVRRLDLLAGRRDVAGARDDQQPADRGLDARRGEEVVGVLGQGVVLEVVGELGELVGEDVVGLGEHPELAGAAHLLLDLSDVLDRAGLLVDPLDRVGLELEVVLDGQAPQEDGEAGHGEGDRGPRRERAEAHHEAAEVALAEVLAGGRGAELSDAEGGQGQDDRRQADDGDADGQEQAELADHRDLGEAQGGEGEDGVEGDDQQGRAEAASGLLDGVVGSVEDDLLLHAGVHLDRVVDADAEQHGQAGDGDDRQRDAEVAGEAEGPDDAEEDHGHRQQAPADVEEDEEDQDHDPDGDGAQGEHPAPQVVVDVPQEDRGAGRDHGRVRERELGRLVLHELGGGALGLDVLVAGQADDDLGVLGVGEEGAQRDADVALVVEEEEVDPLGVVQRPLLLGYGGQPLEGHLSVSGPGLSLRRAFLFLPERPYERGARDAVGRVAVVAGHEGVVELERGQRGDDAVGLAALGQGVVEVGELLDAIRGEELGHGVALVHRDHGEHGLAAEQVLVGDAVLVDLIGLVEVAVLAGGELELVDARAEHQGDQADDDADDDCVLAQLDGESRPEPLHAFPPGTRRRSPVDPR